MAVLNNETPVGEWVTNHPELIPWLEAHQVDYCCGGTQPLKDACGAAGVDPKEVVNELTRLQESEPPDRDSGSQEYSNLTELCAHIEDTHHAYLRETLPQLEELVMKVRDAHSGSHPELAKVEISFRKLCAELIPHLLKEEQILFPAIRRLEKAEQPLEFSFGAVRNPICAMEHEHYQAGESLKKLRELTEGYQVPEDACPSYRALYEGLENLEADLHQHIHKENNILFPRAAELEASF